jgi:hypothetical protein
MINKATQQELIEFLRKCYRISSNVDGRKIMYTLFQDRDVQFYITIFG